MSCGFRISNRNQTRYLLPRIYLYRKLFFVKLLILLHFSNRYDLLSGLVEDVGVVFGADVTVIPIDEWKEM